MALTKAEHARMTIDKAIAESQSIEDVEFRKKVIAYFEAEYEAEIAPNQEKPSARQRAATARAAVSQHNQLRSEQQEQVSRCIAELENVIRLFGPIEAVSELRMLIEAMMVFDQRFPTLLSLFNQQLGQLAFFEIGCEHSAH